MAKRKLPDQTCVACGCNYRPPRTDSRFCSQTCAWNTNRGRKKKVRPRAPRIILACTIEGCGNDAYRRGFCCSHYQRLKLHGDPLGGGRYLDGAPLRFMEAAKEYLGDECLTWPYGCSGGYARITIGEKTHIVSRLICQHAYGHPPCEGMEAAHSCGNGHLGCIARKHLRWATHLENMGDMVGHGRSARGEKHATAKLSLAEAAEIRALWPQLSQSTIATMFGISQTTVSQIVLGKRWADMREGNIA